MKTYRHRNLSQFSIVAIRGSKSGPHERLWILMKFDKKTIDKYGISMSSPGWAALGGPWYKKGLKDHRTYGKLLEMKYVNPKDVICVFSEDYLHIVSGYKLIKNVL